MWSSTISSLNLTNFNFLLLRLALFSYPTRLASRSIRTISEEEDESINTTCRLLNASDEESKNQVKEERRRGV